MVRRLVKNTIFFLYKKQESVLSAAGIIMVTVFLSRVLGLFRDRLLTGRFTPQELGIYFAAFRLPNLIFELLIIGALATAFIPIFSSYLSEKKKKEAFIIASSAINISSLIFLILAFPLLFFAQEISFLIAPGFSKSEIMMMADFTRIMIFAQVFPLVIGNFFTGILQSFNRFLIPALAPIVYNLGIIIGIVFLSPFLGLYGPVWGVVLGAFLFMIIQIPLALSLGYHHSLIFDFHHPGVKEIGKLMLPRTLGLAVSQIDTTVDLILASFLGARSVAIFNFAQHLQQLPIGLFGAPIAQASFPLLSRVSNQQSLEEFKQNLLNAFHQILFLVLPSSVILIVLRIPLVRLIFGAARFDWEATILTGQTLAFFSLSLFAQSLIHLLTRGFYALHDTKTPVRIGALCVFINTILSIWFVKFLFLPVYALGFSTSIASILNFLLLLAFLDQKLKGFNKAKLFWPALKILIASVITGFCLYLPMKLLDQLVFDTTRTLNLIFLTGIAGFCGLGCYLFLAWFLEIKEVGTFLNLIKKLTKIRKVFFETLDEASW